MARFIEQTLLDGVTATTTSSPMNIEGLKRVGIQFVRADSGTGSSAFTVDGTVDGNNWVTLNMLIDNVANTNAQTLTRVASKVLSTDTSALVWLDELTGLKAIRVKVTETTDGTHSAYAIASE